MTPPLRCHLLIAPDGLERAALADDLARRAGGVVLPAAEGLEAALLKQVAAGTPVVVNGCYLRRADRLALTQALRLPAAVEWVGWLLGDGERGGDSAFTPDRAEGFAALVALPVEGWREALECLWPGLNRRIANGRNPDQARTTALHGYARLLDLERLLFLMQLLVANPGLMSGIAAGGMAERASVEMRERYGSCYADPRPWRLIWPGSGLRVLSPKAMGWNRSNPRPPRPQPFAIGMVGHRKPIRWCSQG